MQPDRLHTPLALRLERAQSRVMTLAERLACHPQVTLTCYPGLASNSTHHAARRQLRSFGTIISFKNRKCGPRAGTAQIG